MTCCSSHAADSYFPTLLSDAYKSRFLLDVIGVTIIPEEKDLLGILDL
jgi:hypothetical protein